MEKFFTYKIRNGNRILRIGKGHCFFKSESEIIKYITSRYGREGWTASDITWHYSEAAALKKETVLLDDYFLRYSSLPPWNKRRGGGGRQIYFKCRGTTSTGFRCSNDSLDKNRGYCGIHRR